VRAKDLPPELKDFHVTLVADIQVDRYTGEEQVDRVHGFVCEQDPQVLLFSGDAITGGIDYLVDAVRAMCRMKGSFASFAVLGDHNYWSAPGEIRALQVECGWIFLENEHRVIDWQGKRFDHRPDAHLQQEAQ